MVCSELETQYSVEWYKLFPADESLAGDSRETAMVVAPELVDVTAIDKRALENPTIMAKTLDDIHGEIYDFIGRVKESHDESFTFDARFEAVSESRDRGFLHISISTIAELVDRSLEKGVQQERRTRTTLRYVSSC